MERQEIIKFTNEILKNVSDVLEVKLSLDEEGICTFKIQEDIIAIEVSSDIPGIHIYSPLLALPMNDKDAILDIMSRTLELNAFQLLTRGGAIATAPGSGYLIYCYTLLIENMDTEKFSRALGSFYETIHSLREMLTGSAAVDVAKNRDFIKGIKI